MPKQNFNFIIGLGVMITTLLVQHYLDTLNTKILQASPLVPNHVRLETSNVTQKFLKK